MKLTRQRQAYLAVLGLGLLGLVLDRALLSPAGAEAAAESLAPAETAEPDPLVLVTEPPPSRPTLAGRLREVERTYGFAWGEEQVRDAFRPSDSWRRSLSQVETTDEDPSAQVAELFRQKFRLQAVVTGPSGGIARLVHEGGERMLKVGQTLDGVALVSVDARTATFRAVGGGEPFRLGLEAPHLKQSSEIGAGREASATPDWGPSGEF